MFTPHLCLHFLIFFIFFLFPGTSIRGSFILFVGQATEFLTQVLAPVMGLKKSHLSVQYSLLKPGWLEEESKFMRSMYYQIYHLCIYQINGCKRRSKKLREPSEKLFNNSRLNTLFINMQTSFLPN